MRRDGQLCKSGPRCYLSAAPSPTTMNGTQIGGVCLVRLAFVDQGQHGTTEGFCVAELLIAGSGCNGSRDKFHRGSGVDCPVGDEQGARACIDERARKAGERLLASGRRIARGQDHPVGIEVERGYLRS